MTVCVAIKVHDCLVFAADSTSTLSATGENGQQSVLNVYNNADKVFNLHRKLPIMAMTAGMGHLAGRSIASIAKEFRIQLTDGDLDTENYTVEDIANSAKEFIDVKYTAAKELGHNGALEFWVGGYGSKNDHAEIWKIILADGRVSAPEKLVGVDDSQSINWGGQGSAVARLVLGIDPLFVDVTTNAGVAVEDAMKIFKTVRTSLEVPLIDAAMPIIDAIRFAEFLVKTTIGFYSFKHGADIVGGACDLATVTKHEGFKWIKRKHYYPHELNRGDHDHAG